jgi:eukaryotic-like serine/threonine-protein kinase
MSSSIDCSPSPSPSFSHPVVDRALLRATIEARLGRTVDQRYTLTRLLGVGGMAAVYEAVGSAGERVAIKVLHPEQGARIDRRKRFLREAYLANAIEHSGVARIHADGVDHDGSVFLVMELLEGATVRTLQQRSGGRIELELALRIADQVLDVLGVAHAGGVTHRDIKPENLFVTHEGRVKLLDFGLAHMRDSVPGMTLRTLPGALLGTPPFMAPEQLLGCGEVGPRSDLFALGATLFTLISGEPVRATRTYEPALRRETIFAARALRSAWPAAPEPIAAVIDRALRFEPDARWPDAGSMQRALRAARRGGQLQPGSDPAEPAADARRSDPTVMLAAALHASTARARRQVLGIVAAALLVLAAFALLTARARRSVVPRPTSAESAPSTATAIEAPSTAPSAISTPLVPERVPHGVDAPELAPAGAASPVAEPATTKRSGAANRVKAKRSARRR